MTGPRDPSSSGSTGGSPTPADPPVESEDDGGAIRDRWRDLVGRRLPEVARDRRWPVVFDHCFARILLDNAMGRPWREAVRPPAWRNTPLPDLERAIRLGDAALAGEADMHALNDRSLALRGKSRRR